MKINFAPCLCIRWCELCTYFLKLPIKLLLHNLNYELVLIVLVCKQFQSNMKEKREQEERYFMRRVNFIVRALDIIKHKRALIFLDVFYSFPFIKSVQVFVIIKSFDWVDFITRYTTSPYIIIMSYAFQIWFTYFVLSLISSKPE